VNGFAMFCHFTSTALGLPTVTDGHAPNFSSCSGAFLIGLRQWRLVEIPDYLLRRLQSVLNATAQLIFRLKLTDHITDTFISLHWLQVPGCTCILFNTRSFF